MMSPARLLAPLISLVLLAPAPAFAFGALLPKPAATLRVRDARMAFSAGSARSTLWVQVRLDGVADELLWVLPVPPGGAVDLSSAGLLDAMEQATAPRIKPPGGAAPKNVACAPPSGSEVVTGGEFETPTGLTDHSFVADVPGLHALVKGWGFDDKALDDDALGQAVQGGAGLLALRLDGAGADLGVVATPSVRIHAAGLGSLPLKLTKTDGDPVPYTLWLVGPGRGRLDGAGEAVLEPSALRWLSPQGTNYEALRKALVSKNGGASLLLEMTAAGALASGTPNPGETAVPSVVDAYLSRASARGAAPGDLGQISQKVHDALAAGSFDDACPRDDLVTHTGYSCDPPSAKPNALVPAPAADDLAHLFPGLASERWVSRFAGQIAASSHGPQLSPGFPGGGEVSPVRTPANVWDALCSGQVTPGGPTGAGGATGLGGGSAHVPGGGAATQGNGGDPGSETEAVVVVEEPSRGGCWAEPWTEINCGSDSSSSSDTSGCDCGKSSSDQNHDGCACSGSSGDDQHGGCDCGSSGSSGGGESCGGSSGGESCGGSSGGGDSCKNCAVARGPSRPRFSKLLLLAAAIALPLRRLARPRRRENGY
jgi:hypothetical protein